MKDKKYKSIAEVSELLKINKHVIRYWDAKFDDISTRLSDNKRRFFNIENIKKLQELKNILYQNGRHNYSSDLAKKIVKHKSKKNEVSIINKTGEEKFNIVELQEISNNLKELLE
jgi:DNA-binding transcriptional MerR regulator